MQARLPPLNSVRAFEAVARHLNLSAAAEELHVTKGAVSLQLKRLEEDLGIALLERGARGFSLTPAGEAYFGAVNGALSLIAQATQQARVPSLPIVTLSCTPGFAQQWLLPRLPRLEAVAKLDLRIRATNAVCDFGRDQVDFAVRHGRGPYPGLVAHRLFDDDLVVIAAPNLRRPGRRKPEVSDLEGHQLLHDEHRGDWRLWLEAAGLPSALAQRGPVFEHSNAAIEAAAAGQGLALAPLPLVQPMIEQRRLVRWWSGSLKTKLAYRLVHPAWVLRKPEALLFRDWLLGEAGPRHAQA